MADNIVPFQPKPGAPDAAEQLEACWHDQREKDFSVEIDDLLKKVADAIDTSNEPGPAAPRVAIARALAVIDDIRAKLVGEAVFRGPLPGGIAMKTIAARIAAALKARKLAESVVQTATLAIEQHSCDNTNQIAQTLEDCAWAEIWKVYQHLHAAMELIPESDRPDDFDLDETHEAPDLEDA